MCFTSHRLIGDLVLLFFLLLFLLILLILLLLLVVWPINATRAGIDENHKRNERRTRYLDRKWALRGEEDSGWLALRFEVTKPGTPVAVCEVACAWNKCPEARGSLLDAVEYELGEAPKEKDGQEAPASLPRAQVVRTEAGTAPLFKMLVSSKVCFEIKAADSSAQRGLSIGSHILRMRVIHRKKYVLLSHLIWF